MTTQLRIDGPIDSVTAQHVRDALASAPGPVEVFINSPGGEVGEGIAIYNALRAHKAGVTVTVDGFALSVASAIACAGRPTRAMANSTWMLHAPWTNSTGDAKAMRSAAEALDKVAEALIAIYSERTGKRPDELRELLTVETWMTAQEAVAFGLADEVLSGRGDDADTETHRAMAAYATAHFRNVPVRIQNMTQPQNAASILAAETQRRDEIRNVFGRHSEQFRPILDACLDDPKITADAASRKLLAAFAEGAGPVAGIGAGLRWAENDRLPDFMAAATDALLQRGGIAVAKPHSGARDLARMSLTSMAESCASMRNGGSRPGAGIFATHTNSDFPYLLANVANKSLMAGYESEPASHLAWVKQTDAADFRTMSRVARSEAPPLLEVVEGAEIPFGSFSERREQFAISTLGRRFAITRQAVQNDDLGALVDMPRAFGQAARRAEANAVYSILTTNAAMSDSIALFHADHNNLSAASASVAIATLGAARAAMRRQVGPGGGLLNVQPRFLLVPASLEMAAEELLASATRADHPADVANPFLRSLQLVVDPRLDAHSVTAWYLLGHHSQIDTIELARLEGRGVVVDEEQTFADGSLQFRAILDFGVKAIDHRGMYRYHTS